MRLSGTADAILVLCDSAQRVDVYASWEDTDPSASNGRAVGGGRSLVAGESTDAQTVVEAPPRNILRQVEYVSVKAAIANVSPVTARLQMTNGTTTIDLFSAPLEPGDQYFFEKHNGFQFVPASGQAPTTADLVTQFIQALQPEGLPT